MNHSKLFTGAVLIGSIALLVGCNNQSSPGSSTALTSETITTVSAADSEAYLGAMKLMDDSFCTKIVDLNYQKQCQNDVSDAVVFQAAITQQDLKSCDQIKNEDNQKACKIKIEVEEKLITNQKQQNDEENKDSALLQSLITTGDYQKCSQLKLTGNQFDCEINILGTQALSAKDSNLCAKASSEGIKNSCLKFYSQASQ